jgi:hypothetical protein
MRGRTVWKSAGLITRKSQVQILPAQPCFIPVHTERRYADIAILTPDLNVEVYNADYRALPQIPWQQAVRLILRREVHVMGVRNPAVHVHSP